jgi:hypothetical protein
MCAGSAIPVNGSVLHEEGGGMKTFLDGPLRLLLAVISLFGLWRSLITIIAAVQDETSPWRTGLVYLLLLLGLFFGVYLIRHEAAPEAKDGQGAVSTRQERGFTQSRLLGTLLLAVSLSLMLNGWLGPYLRIGSPPASPTPTPTPSAQATGTARPLPGPHATLAPSPSPAQNPIPTASARPTRAPEGVKMEVVVARLHVRQSPTSQSPSRGELNNGDWLFFDAKIFDSQGTLWLRIGRDQHEDRFKLLTGFWVYAGGVSEVGLIDLPLHPATATPSG